MLCAWQRCVFGRQHILTNPQNYPLFYRSTNTRTHGERETHTSASSFSDAHRSLQTCIVYVWTHIAVWIHCEIYCWHIHINLSTQLCIATSRRMECMSVYTEERNEKEKKIQALAVCNANMSVRRSFASLIYNLFAFHMRYMFTAIK